LPKSGAGAAANGGRFNRPSVEAQYLSVEPETALAEYRQGATIGPPATRVAYIVAVSGVIDFSGGYDPETWPEEWAETGCDRKYIARVERHSPPTWSFGDRLISSGVR
jgi:RES domain-containing protein